MKGQRLRVKAKIIREIFSGDNGYKILGCKPLESVNGLVVHPVYRNFTLVGECPFLNEGDTETLDIEEMGKDKYGIKYNLINVPSMKIDELTDDNEYSYLCKITTPSQARYIHNAYPNYIRLILNDKIEEIDVSKIYNVKEVRHKIYVREILDRYKYLQIICCLPQYKITLQEARDLGSSYATIEEVREALNINPYKVLYEVLKRPFKRVDSLLLSLNPALKESPQRKEYCIIAFLKEYEARTGSTRVLGNEIAINLRQEYPECLKDMKEICKNSSGIYYNEETKEIALMASYVAECEISLFIKERLKTSVDLNLPYQEYMEFDNIKLTEEQGELLKNASKYKISILLGHSGGGKTSAVKGLVEMLKDNEYTYTLLAPTGKASKRLSQTTGENCCTIHKACFSELGIGTDFVIIDECSMISLELMKMLIDAISSEKTRVVLIGDNAQLSPIGAGNVFQDIIMSQEVPIAKLTKIFRYSDGGVIKVATDIRTGKSFFESEEPVQHYGNNFTFKQTEVEVAFDNIVDEYMLALKKHAPEDIMIISPQNVGSIGTYIINNKIQSIVNPMKPNQEALSRKIDNIQVVFREGDYVINKKNNYEAMDEKTYLINKKNRKTDLTDEEINILEERENNKNKNAVFNGESGRVIKVTKDYLVVDFFDQREIVFDKAGISNLLLSYCQTCHSVQGSQAKHVINITLPCHKKMLSRNLLYVAETRSEGTVVELGDMQTIEEAIKIAENERRNTFLEGLLREE